VIEAWMRAMLALSQITLFGVTPDRKAIMLLKAVQR
jgi:hypothetical protein